MTLTLKQQLQATDEHENRRIAPRPETFLLEEGELHAGPELSVSFRGISGQLFL
jgi:hypothetical protein